MLARRLGFWDLYHEIEVDAQGFGPANTRASAEKIPMVFVEPPALTDQSPPTRVPALAPPSNRVQPTKAPALEHSGATPVPPREEAPAQARTAIPAPIAAITPCASQFGFGGDLMQELGCPADRAMGRAVVYERFKNGTMVVFAGPDDSWVGGAILVLSSDGRAWCVTDSFARKSQNPDEWYCCEPRPGRRPEQSGIPWRGFGKVWCENPDVRGTLGNATSGEEVTRGSFEVYERGRAFQINRDRVYLLNVPNDGWAAAGRWQ